jgi:hypothetical protein
MNRAATIIQMLVRLTGFVQIGLGLLFWTGNALTLIPLHMLVGLIIVLGLWTLAGLAVWAGVNRGLIALAIVWGIITPIFGVTQAQLLPGPAHWVIQLLHLVVGLIALGLADNLATRIKRQRLTPAHA